MVERLAAAYEPTDLDLPFLRILPLALDASMLVNQVAYVARRGRSGLLDAADLGVVRLYAGETIASEVESRLFRRARSGRQSAQELFDAWRDVILPRLRMVDTQDIHDAALGPILKRDPTDRPTAALSIVLGARLTLSEDPDLLHLDYAVRFAVEVHFVPAHQAGLFDISAHFGFVIH